ncbi:hypothetical protein SUDANB120_04099 [Streptomyces sp. enrichment culture]|uniref:hypothetical protein n=1 Tax=Streptomyces TaxID=1883 RepID=UPI0016778B7C|nr:MULTISPECIES: hypothetical protein [Streptomyces]MBD3576621.1 hypothetical protein [Streptomyces sp. KD18]GGT06418.1 hypothetical protein GCM10010286_34640 [Streptomyces toxytricini]
MSVDPAEPDTFRGEFRESLDAEAPEADAAEQLAELRPDDDDDRITGVERGEANDGDAVEQARVVPLDEEDYR